MGDAHDGGDTDDRLFEAVRVHPDGASTAARCALTAAEYGYDGIVLRNHADALGDVDATAIRERYGVDVVEGVEIVAEDPSRASGYLGSHRPETTVLAVHGGTDEMNRFVVEQPAVDVLAHPTADGAELNQVLARTAAENGVRLEVSLAPLVGDTGGGRVRAITGLRRLWTLIDHFEVPYVVTVGADSHLALRAPREVSALCATIGMEDTDVRRGLAEWRRLAARNRMRRSDSFVEPGVWREEV